jgi:hypothetical protein
MTPIRHWNHEPTESPTRHAAAANPEEPLYRSRAPQRRTSAPRGEAHELDQCIHCIGTDRTFGNAVPALYAASFAAMDELPALLRSQHSHRSHVTAASTQPIAWKYVIDVQRVEAAVAVIAVAAIRQRGYACTTLVAHECRVFCVSPQSPISSPLNNAMAEVGCGYLSPIGLRAGSARCRFTAHLAGSRLLSISCFIRVSLVLES